MVEVFTQTWPEALAEAISAAEAFAVGVKGAFALVAVVLAAGAGVEAGAGAEAAAGAGVAAAAVAVVLLDFRRFFAAVVVSVLVDVAAWCADAPATDKPNITRVEAESIRK